VPGGGDVLGVGVIELAPHAVSFNSQDEFNSQD